MTVQEEAEQNKQLLKLSNQILALTQEVRGFAQQDHEQNEELLELSRRTLALTEAVHKSAGAGGRGSGELDRSADHDLQDDDE